MNPWQPSPSLQRADSVHWAVRVYGMLTVAYALWMGRHALRLLLLQDVFRAPPFGVAVLACLALAAAGVAPGLAALLGWPQARSWTLAWSSMVLAAVAVATAAFTVRVRAHPTLFVLAAGWPAMCFAAFSLAFGPRRG